MKKPAANPAYVLSTDRFDELESGVVLVEREGRLAYVNRAAGLMLGEEPALLLGRRFRAVAAPLGEALEAVFAEGAALFGSRLQLHGRQIVASLFPVFAEDAVAQAAVHLVDFHQAEPGSLFPQPYQELMAQLEAIMDSTFDGLWISDHRGVVVRVNQAALKMVRQTREEVEGRNVADLVTEGSFQESVTLEVLRRKTAVTMIQHLRSGAKVLATGVPVFNQAKEVAFVVINDRDITLLDRLRREIEQSQAQLEHYRSELSRKRLRDLGPTHAMCQSRAMQAVYEQALRVAKTNSTVLITGESGVGKGILAKLIHQESPRASGPFIRVDCAAIPSTLFESEMFGYAKGAFTGADLKGKVGLVALAQGGTLFLDEIAEVAPEAQVKLLRFLDERRYVPVGGSSELQLDTRVVAATNRDLVAEVEARRFREDLFYRFNVVPLNVPPLRERPRDILHLTRFFMERIGEENQLIREISPRAQELLLSYAFPGNVRELENLVERMLIMSTGPAILPEDLPPEVRSGLRGGLALDLSLGLDLRQHLRMVELEIIQETIKRLGNQRAAAKHLGISQSALARKLQALNR